ncbi:MAG TPA: DUF1285 domain-containing protein [Rhodospirillales bacterium]|nr:DUF1285 domain-containing protein [Rhodospirillales bacterium]
MTVHDHDSGSAANKPPPDRLPLDAICGEFDIRIDRTGQWHYHGSPIGRIELVKLFSTVLQRDEKGDFYLITPVEKGRIQVDDAPFMAIVMTVEGAGESQKLHFETNVGDTLVAGPEHPIRVITDRQTGEPSPYVRVRGGEKLPLEAKINRPVFYDLVELAVEHETSGGRSLGVWSDGHFFTIGTYEANT